MADCIFSLSLSLAHFGIFARVIMTEKRMRKNSKGRLPSAGKGVKASHQIIDEDPFQASQSGDDAESLGPPSLLADKYLAETDSEDDDFVRTPITCY
jgi:hypothetical protein